MLKRLSEKLAEKLVHTGIISEADADVHVYGFFQLTMLLINLSTIILLGVMFKEMLLCVILNIAYIPIRVNAGGYHANSPFRCYINSTITIAVLLAVLKWGSFSEISVCLMVACSTVVIWFLAPMGALEQPLDEAEKKVYGTRTRVVLSIEMVASLCLMFMHLAQISAAIVLGILTEAVMLVVGKIKQHRSKC